MRNLILALFASVYVLPAASQPVHVKMADYAFDFAAYGHEITVEGETRNYHDKLTADDYITIVDDGYTMKTLIDRMGRRDRQQFIAFFNDHCVVGFITSGCTITASGEIELDENMRMIFRVINAKISMDGQEWTNSEN